MSIANFQLKSEVFYSLCGAAMFTQVVTSTALVRMAITGHLEPILATGSPITSVSMLTMLTHLIVLVNIIMVVATSAFPFAV